MHSSAVHVLYTMHINSEKKETKDLSSEPFENVFSFKDLYLAGDMNYVGDEPYILHIIIYAIQFSYTIHFYRRI